MSSAPRTKIQPSGQGRSIFLKDRKDFEYQAKRSFVLPQGNVFGSGNPARAGAASTTTDNADNTDFSLPMMLDYVDLSSTPQLLEVLTKLRDELRTLATEASSSATVTGLQCFSRPMVAKLVDMMTRNLTAITSSVPFSSSMELLYLGVVCIYYLVELDLYTISIHDLEVLATVIRYATSGAQLYSPANMLVYETVIQVVANVLATKHTRDEEILFIIQHFCPVVLSVCGFIHKNAAPAVFYCKTSSFWFASNAALFYTRCDTDLSDPTYQICLQLLPMIVDTFLFLFHLAEPLWVNEVQLKMLVETVDEPWKDSEHAMSTLDPQLELFYVSKQLSYLSWAMTFFCDAENTTARKYICLELYRNSNIMTVLLGAMYELPIHYAVGIIHILLKTLGSILNALSQDDLDCVLSGNLLHAFYIIVEALFAENLDAPHTSSIHVVAGIFWVCSNLAISHPQVFMQSGLVSYFLLGIQSAVPLLCRNAFLALTNILYYLQPADHDAFLDMHEESLWEICAGVLKRSFTMKWEHRNRVVQHCVYVFDTILNYDSSIYLTYLDEILDDIAELQSRELLEDHISDEVSRRLLVFK